MSPDPFDDVESLRVVAATPGATTELDRVRWDQGPRALGEPLPLRASRVWVEGLDAEGLVSALASSPPLDLVDAPPDRLELLFVRVGALSRVPGAVPPREGWRAASVGSAGVLLLGGTDPTGQTPAATWWIDAEGVLRPGPSLPGGRSGAAVASVGRRVVVWGGDAGGRAAEAFVVLDPAEGRVGTGPNPIDPGRDPVVVASDARRALAVDRAGARVAELDLVDARGLAVGSLDAAASGAAVARWGPGQVVVVGGRGLPSAAIFDARASRYVGGPIDLDGDRAGGAAVTTGARAIVVAGGADDGVPVRGVRTLTWSLPPRGPGEGSAFAPGVALARARGWDAGGGTLVYASAPGSGTGWRVDLLGGRATPMSVPEAGFDLAPHPDGTLRGVADDGSLLAFAAGPGRFAPSSATGAGIVPRRPEQWRIEAGGLVGSAPRPALAGSIEPPSWAVLGEGRLADFRLEVDVAPQVTARGLGRAAVLFDLAEDGYDVLLLRRSAQIRAGPERARLGCPAADVAALDEGMGQVRIRLERRGNEIRLDVGADGSVELRCETPRVRPGRIALGVLEGEVRFEGLLLSGEDVPP